MIVLDTNVVSEPLRLRPDEGVLEWLDAQAPETLFISVVTVAELLSGVEGLPAGKRKRELHDRIQSRVLPLFAGRCLSFDEEAACAFAVLHQRAQAAGNRMAFSDAVIASIVHCRGFALATRNVKDFRSTGIALINPWTA